MDPTHSGNDVTITISGDTDRFRDDPSTGQPSPDLSTWNTGGISPYEMSLALALNYANRNQEVAVTMSFLYDDGVVLSPVTIFNVDRGTGSFSYNYQDQLRDLSGQRLDDSLVAATITGSVSNQVTGSGLSQVVTGIGVVPNQGTDSDAGNVTVDFGSEVLKAFSFTLGSGSGSRSDPRFQGISIYDVEFTPVPEAGTVAAAAAAGLIAAAWLRRRARAAAPSASERV
ncbi:MAG: hypothetical protein IT578_04570 [Verrucomicrobiae bacterium]|nr:hypothetical protein [Verrucomicrobiae bacterium]